MHIRTLELILHQTSILFLGLTPIKTLAIMPMVPLGPYLSTQFRKRTPKL